MRRRAYQIISYLFHPLLMPTFAFILLFTFLPHVIRPLGLVTLPFLFVTTCVIPIISISMLKFSGSITNFRLEKREERILPFSFVTIFYGITTYMFVFQVKVNQAIALMLISTTLLVLILTIITLWFKISIHTAGVSGVVGILIAFGIKYPGASILYPLIGMIFVAGLTMSARLHLNIHTPKEIFAGVIAGLTICFSSLVLFD